MVRRLAAVLLLAVAVGHASDGRPAHKSPRLASVFPQGAEPGSALTVEVLGQHLDRLEAVGFLQPGIRGTVLSTSHTRVSLALEVDSSAGLGPHYFRAFGPRGASNVMLFRVGDQPHRLEAEPNGALGRAQAVHPPTTLNGRIDRADDIDIFRFRAEAGDRWIFDLKAARNGSGLDASMILLGSDGAKLQHSEDRFIWDPFFSHRFEAGGAYYLALQPTRGRARPTFGYQLDIRRAPHLDLLVPLALKAGTAVSATVVGTGLDSSGASLEFSQEGASGRVVSMDGDRGEVLVEVDPEAPRGLHSLSVETPRGRSNPVPFWVHDLPVHVVGTALTVPSAVQGVAPYERPDRFAFEASEGETVVFEVLARRLGSPTDVTLRLVEIRRGEDGGDCCPEVASNDDADLPGVRFNKDPKLFHTFRKSGEYELQVRNLWQTSRLPAPYHLEARRPRPAIELLLDRDRIHAYPGGEATLGLSVRRIEGHGESVELSVIGLPSGVTAEPVVVPAAAALSVPEGDRSQKATISLRTDSPERTRAAVQVVATRTGTPAWSDVRIASGGGEGATETRLQGLAFAIAERPRFELAAQLRTVNLVRGGRAALPVELLRDKGFAEAVRFGFENLPPGVSFDPATAAGDRRAITIGLQAGADAVRGSYPTVAVIGTAESGAQEQAPVVTVVVD